MDFWHLIFAHHEFRNAPCTRRRRSKYPMEKIPWKKAIEKIKSHGWISTPPSALGFLFLRRTSKTRFLWSFASWLCGRFVAWWPCTSAGWQWGPLRGADGDDGKTRRCGVLWVWGYGLKTGWFPWTWFWDLRVNLGWVFSLRKQPLNGSFTLAKGPNI